jgi:hypothetical protein
MPQKSGRKGTGLTEIQEGLAEKEEEEEEEEEEEGVEMKENGKEGGGKEREEMPTSTNGGGPKKVPLNRTEDPLKRFQVEAEMQIPTGNC